jgi:hypothetical protein
VTALIQRWHATTGWRWLCTLILLVGTACGDNRVIEKEAGTQMLDGLDQESRTALAGSRIFFGHQSVGGNIAEGIAEVLAATPSMPLPIIDAGDVTNASGGFFAHTKVGRNLEPRTKTEAFAAMLDGGLAGRLDIAFHKYCYVDIGSDTDVDALFEFYSRTMARLRASYPRVTFVHVTCPLMAIQSGVGAMARTLFGKPPEQFRENLRRGSFNARMRREYIGREPLFDLAAVESTAPDGAVARVSYRGDSQPTLVGSFTYDGGHLNEKGRRRVAEQLLVFLAGLRKATPARQ